MGAATCVRTICSQHETHGTGVQHISPAGEHRHVASQSAVVYLANNSGTVLQAVMVREALIYILQHHLLTIRNCCYLLETARQASVGSLTQRAFELLCGNFIPVLQCHGGTLVELSKETLMLVLCSDSLQVRTMSASTNSMCTALACLQQVSDADSTHDAVVTAQQAVRLCHFLQDAKRLTYIISAVLVVPCTTYTESVLCLQPCQFGSITSITSGCINTSRYSSSTASGQQCEQLHQ